MSNREVMRTYHHDPGPQWTASQLKAALADVPDETLLQVMFSIEEPHKRLADFQPVVRAEFLTITDCRTRELVRGTTCFIVSAYKRGACEYWENVYDEAGVR